MLNIDYRENKLIQLLEQRGLDFTKENLMLGDVQINVDNTTCIIERKTLDDFSSSIIDGRYSEQKSRLLASNAIVVYIVEGISKSQRGIPLSTIQSAIVSCQYKDNIIVLRSINIEETLDIIQILAKKITDKSLFKETPSVVHTKKSTNCDVYISMLCCIPGISTTIANNIKSKFPTLLGLLNYIEATGSLTSVEKIGKKMSDKIVTTLMS